MDDNREHNGRFKKGVSPNPKGRPRKDRSVSTAILTAALSTVTANENGKRRKIPKLEATATQIANKGASGDLRAAKMLMDMTSRAEADKRAALADDALLSQSDQEIVDRFLADYRQHLKETDL